MVWCKGSCMKFEKLTDTLVRKLYENLEVFSFQKKGCSADYIVDDKYCLEVKLDFAAEKTGNIFVEYANKYGNFVTESGISLSAKWDYSVLYFLKKEQAYHAYELLAQELLNLAKKHGTKKQTRAKANGNRAGFYALGYILNIKYIENFFKKTIELL